MTTITLDDAFVAEITRVSPYQNAQEAVVKILADYLQQQKSRSAIEKNELTDFQKFLLESPEMSEQELQFIEEKRALSAFDIEAVRESRAA